MEKIILTMTPVMKMELSMSQFSRYIIINGGHKD